MKKSLLTFISTVVFFMGLSAFAYTQQPNTQPAAASTLGMPGEETTEQAAVIGGGGDSVDIDRRATAKGIIGQDLRNAADQKIATVRDIIVDKNGKALKVIAENGGFLGLGGQLIAFDYDSIVSRADSGDILKPVSSEIPQHVSAFSYQSNPGFSVKKMMDAKLRDDQGKRVADVTNMTMRNGAVDKLIVATGLFGIGGERLAIDYSLVKIAPNRDFQMSAETSARFGDYKTGKMTASSK